MQIKLALVQNKVMLKLIRQNLFNGTMVHKYRELEAFAKFGSDLDAATTSEHLINTIHLLFGAIPHVAIQEKMNWLY